MTTLDYISSSILSFIRVIDSMGAESWSATAVVLTSLGLLLATKLIFHKQHGIDWYCFLHAIVSAIGACMCVWLNVFAAETMTGVAEPLRSVTCQGPLTSLHRIIPMITMGYSVLDLLDGVSLGVDFLAHGAATLTIMGFFIYKDIPHVIVPMLLMEFSTMFLTVVRADFFPDYLSLLNQLCFVFFFFLFRIILVPIIWYNLVVTIWNEQGSAEYKSCFPSYFLPVVLVFGTFFNLLNVYWMYKILRKLHRKITKKEGIKQNNELGETKKNK